MVSSRSIVAGEPVVHILPAYNRTAIAVIRLNSLLFASTRQSLSANQQCYINEITGIMQIHQFPVFACILLIFSDSLRFSPFYSFIGFLKIFYSNSIK